MKTTYGKNAAGNLIATSEDGKIKLSVEIVAAHWSTRLMFAIFPRAVEALHEGGINMGRAFEKAVHTPAINRLAEIEAKAPKRADNGQFVSTKAPATPKPPRQRGPNGKFIKTPLAAGPT